MYDIDMDELRYILEHFDPIPGINNFRFDHRSNNNTSNGMDIIDTTFREIPIEEDV